jgi:hypothetical protein
MKESTESPEHFEERQWERGWEEHEKLQLYRLARLSLPDKLLWLEQAHRLVRQLQASRSALVHGDGARKDQAGNEIVRKKQS